MTQKIEDERHGRTLLRPCRPLSRPPAVEGVTPGDAVEPYIPDLLVAAAATSLDEMSTVIMNPFVPLNSNAFDPSR